jgi:hypothetical protein
MSDDYVIEVRFEKKTPLEEIEKIKQLIGLISGILSVKYRVKEDAPTKEEKKETVEPSTSNLFSVKQMTKRHPAFSEGSLRSLIFCAKNNNFEQCVRRVGTKVLILEDEFLKWVDGNPTMKIVYSTHDVSKYGR